MGFGGSSFGGGPEAPAAAVGAVASPASLLYKFLLDAGFLPSVPENGIQTGEWSSFIGYMPETPDSAVCFYDTQGMMDGRIMRTGEKIVHPGVMIRFRSRSYGGAWDKATLARDALDALSWASVDFQDETWLIQCVSRTSDVVSMGLDPADDRRRHNFTINAIMTLRKDV